MSSRTIKYARTEWGMKVINFKHRYGISLKEIAEKAGVRAASMNAVMVGKHPGTELREKVDAFIAKYEETVGAPKPIQTILPHVQQV